MERHGIDQRASAHPGGATVVCGDEPRLRACLAICLAVFAVALAYLLAGDSPASSLWLPIGLPWIGAHFRIDFLSAFFLVIVNLGGAAASLYALGYGEHEASPGRVLPFYPAFLAGMNLVILADDAFSFLFAWEFMSLTSWALVMAHHEDPDNRRAGYIYIVMASFGMLPSSWRSAYSQVLPVAMRSTRCAARPACNPDWSWSWFSWAPVRRQGLCLCMSGFPSLTPLHQATSRR